jgi:hypothetical protein
LFLDSGFHRNDRRECFSTSYKFINYDAQEKKVKKTRTMMHLDMVISVGGVWEPYGKNMPVALPGAAPCLPFR